ncbi:MAG TPA: hypothetical protein DEA08_28275, partial [Planctomycetes bacterium]|nr:hypothetical protein [Planctomycetota bacterium]
RWGYDLTLRLSADEALPIRDEGEHRSEAEALAERERDLTARAGRLLEGELAPEGKGHARALRSLRSIRQEGQAIDEELARLDEDLSVLRAEQERSKRLFSAAAEKVDLVKGRKVAVPPPSKRKQTLKQREREVQLYQWTARVRAGRELVDDVDELISAASRLERAGQPIDGRVATLTKHHLELKAQERALRRASREDEGEWRRAVERVAGVRADGQRLWQEAERLDERRVVLSDEVAQGRIARFEAWGSVRHDLLALAGFAGLCAGVAALGLRRS